MNTDRHASPNALFSKTFIVVGIVAACVSLFLMLLVVLMLFQGRGAGGDRRGADSGIEARGQGDGWSNTGDDDHDREGTGENHESEKTTKDGAERKQTQTARRQGTGAPDRTSEEDVVPPDAHVIRTGNGGAAGVTMEGRKSGAPSFFGIWDKGPKVVYVIDRSGSMSGRRLRAAKAQLIGALREMGGEAMLSIIFYDNSYEVMPPESWVKSSAENIEGAVEWVEGISSGGGTNPLPAVEKALGMGPDAVYLLSDGAFAQGAITDRIRQANEGIDARIHTIQFGSAGSVQLLKKIAQDNGGIYRAVSGLK